MTVYKNKIYFTSYSFFQFSGNLGKNQMHKSKNNLKIKSHLLLTDFIVEKIAKIWLNHKIVIQQTY